MKFEDLPQRWVDRLNSRLREIGVDENRLSAETYGHQAVRVTLADGSSAWFHYAFYLIDRELNEVAVFTEHCGHHIFPLYETQLEVFESKWTDVGTD